MKTRAWIAGRILVMTQLELRRMWNVAAMDAFVDGHNYEYIDEH